MFNIKHQFNKNQNSRKTPLLDKLVFNKIRKSVFGDRIQCMYSGGALLNSNVHDFIRVCLALVRLAYGLTEITTSGAVQHCYETDTSICGSLLSNCRMRLVDWEEGGYYCTDKPNPRGEIHIGGDCVSMGYYKLPDASNETFYEYESMRYCATGDIGEVLANGNLKIIDRKKDLVKLLNGEYVSLNKVETCIKLLQYIENCCVYGDPLHSYSICIICPNLPKIQVF